MDKRDKKDELPSDVPDRLAEEGGQSDEDGFVNINLFGDENTTTPEDIIDEQADAMLRDIESGAEDFGPDEIQPDSIAYEDEDDSYYQDEDDAQLADEELDELPESIEIPEETKEAYVAVDDEEVQIEKARRRRRRLRNTLIFFIIVLLLFGAAIGVFIWRNSMSPDVKQPDSDALHTPNAGTATTTFQAIDGEKIPDFVTYFGMTPDEVVEAVGSTIALDAAAVEASDQALPELKFTRNGWIVGTGGEIAANITFGLNQDSKIITTTVTFDLDAYNVADAKFDELISSETVAASMLAGVGVDTAAVDEAKLSIKENPDAVTSRDTASHEQAEFSGSTNREQAPKTWKVTEVYDHTAGKTIGDNSVIRSLTIDLR